jgi:hypothetical protein
MNKYTRWYNQIVKQAQNRTTEGYTERHHIQPRSLGGADTADNLVNLTAREHFVCHWLLTKMTSGEDRYKMLNALRMMRAEKEGQQRYNTAITSRVYETIKKEYAELQSILRSGEGNGFYGKTHTVEARRRISEANKGRIQPPDEKEKQIAAITGRKRSPFSEEWRAKMSESKQGEKNNRFGVEVSSDTRRKIGDKIRGRKQTEEEKALRAEANRGKVKPKKLCPHCGEMIAVNTYSRWHGARCRHNPANTWG